MQNDNTDEDLQAMRLMERLIKIVRYSKDRHRLTVNSIIALIANTAIGPIEARLIFEYVQNQLPNIDQQGKASYIA